MALIFGSQARNEAVAGSDLNLMVIGDIGLRELSSLISGQEEQTGREINSHIYNREEFKKRWDTEDHLISKIMAGEKIFIIGTEYELTGI